jgi:formylglycine-generating enzyme required for sulfatase activity
MVFVTQEDAKEFCRWLGPQYRLPTWQEWGYAGRGGQTYQFPTSNGELFNNGERLANIQYPNDQAGSTTEVKTYAPNPYGLYDMAGNVYEWTYFREESQATSTVPYSGGKFIMGGSFKTQNPAYATTWNRFGLISQDSWTNDIGFRVVFDVNSGTSAAESEINIDGL